MDTHSDRISLQSFTKFFNSVHVVAGIESVSQVVRAQIIGEGLVAQTCDTVSSMGDGSVNVTIQYLLASPRSPWDDILELVYESGDVTQMSLGELARRSVGSESLQRMTVDFVTAVNASGGGRVLDIGGRDRSGTNHQWEFEGVERVVLDVVDGPDVDVVGDAHALAELFPPNHFDAVVAVSVFEHLLAPWQVACEINRVLKPNGLGFVLSHQTIGLHDQPTDFWRFSDQAWRGIFNEATGFAVSNSLMDQRQLILPAMFRPEQLHAERVAGYEASAVVVQKVSECRVSWTTPRHELTLESYPLS